MAKLNLHDENAEFRAYLTERNSNHLEDLAAEKDCFVVYPDEFMVLIDLDGVSFDWENFKLLKRLEMVVAPPEFYKSSGGNHHAILRLAKPTHPAVRIGIAALLGSDPTREILALWRVHTGQDNPTVLFRPKVEIPMRRSKKGLNVFGEDQWADFEEPFDYGDDDDLPF